MDVILPEELLVEILIKLPVKSLLRFRCVCKLWYSLISDSSFVSSQAEHASKNKPRGANRVMLLEHDHQARKFAWKLCEDNDSLDELGENADFPLINKPARRNSVLVIRNCANGLICLLERFVSRPETFIVWNPSTRRYLPLPPSDLEFDPTNAISACGFGYGASTRDYKVVRVVRCYDCSFSGLGGLAEPRGEVFRLSKGSWEEIEVPISLPWMDDSQQAHVGGRVNWLGFRGRNLVVSFDVDEEGFSEIDLPEELRDVWRDSLGLEPWRGYLSVFEAPRYLGDINLWVMKEYGVAKSWAKQLVIRSSGVVRSVFGVRRSGKVLLKGISGNYLLLYDPETDRWSESEVEASRVFQMASFAESSALLDVKEARSY